MRLFKKLRRRLDYLDPEQIDLVEKAFQFAFDAHDGQTRRTGEPYITHPVSVAVILAGMRLDAQSIMAALLHDVLEDTDVQKSVIAEQFGEDVAEIVDGVSKLNKVEGKSLAEYQAENFRKMVLAMARDIRVILVKLADRLHNMRTLGSLPTYKRRRIARETLDIFARIAKRLGMRDFCVELEELSFEALFPQRYRVLSESVKKVRGHRSKVLAMIQSALNEGLGKSDMPPCVIMGREKHIYSIYRKMKQKKLTFNEVMDVYAFRIIVDSVDQCYRVMGMVHRLFKPVPERFKDYIAIPKTNGYQSLHTSLFGPYGFPIEIQIRTTEMDHMATSGIAAHWLYKSTDPTTASPQTQAQEWVKRLLELQKSTGSSLEFIESVKLDLFPEDVYVFTPKGDILQLPTGATSIDFAYTVHTDIGHACVGTKVDRQVVPLSMPLANGQTVEIITSPAGRPSPAWLDIVVTSKARSNLRHYFKNQRAEQALGAGRDLLEKALNQYALTRNDILPSTLLILLKEQGLLDEEALLVEIGMGNRIAVLLVRRLISIQSESNNSQQILPLDKQLQPIIIRGTEGMMLEMSSCCFPLPGDEIIGVSQEGGGVVVHRRHCVQLSSFYNDPQKHDKLMVLSWADRVPGSFTTNLQLRVRNQAGALARITLAIADSNVDIQDISVKHGDQVRSEIKLQLRVRDRQHLAHVMRAIRGLSLVSHLQREGKLNKSDHSTKD